MAQATAESAFPLVNAGRVEPRRYQVNLYRSAARKDTLLVLPTGLGKTVVALLLAAHVLSADRPRREGARVLFLAPTKPLVEQHTAFFLAAIEGARRAGEPGEGTCVAQVTGEVPPAERELLWREADVLVATPQVVRNDLAGGRLTLAGVRLVVFDEAHRATGDYPYVFLAQRFREEAQPGARVLGLTASPGGNARDILDVCGALGIDQVDVRTEEDPDVAPYVHEIAVNWIDVDLPTDFKIVAAKLRRVLDREVRKLQEAGVIRRGNFVSTSDILKAREAISRAIASEAQETKGRVWALASTQAKAMKVNHALEYIETQGREVFLAYMDRLAGESRAKRGSAASKSLIKDADFLEAYALAKASKAVHPKVEAAATLVRRALEADPGARIILFSHFRETGEVLVARLEAVEGCRPVRFVGQATKGKDEGLSQKEQVALIEAFSKGTYNVLVATSVAEEGLDIPEVDHVIFYEPVPSEIRTIQRRGRTGRRREGRVEVLVAKKTRDEAYRRASAARESTMRDELRKLRDQMRLPIDVLEGPGGPTAPTKIDEFSDEEAPGADEAEKTRGDLPALGAAGGPVAVITVDDRELRSPVADLLREAGVPVKAARLSVADFVVGERVGVERKTRADFAASLTDGRLFRQAQELAEEFARAVLVLEGDPAETPPGVRPASIEGAVAALLVDFSVAVFPTGSPEGTADLLLSLARREGASHPPGGGTAAKRPGKRPVELVAQQRFVLEGIPGVSTATARRLLRQFGSVRAVAQASVDDLMKVEGVGRATAEKVYEVLRAPYPADG
jgi:Fanconi anemia group M protein